MDKRGGDRNRDHGTDVESGLTEVIIGYIIFYVSKGNKWRRGETEDN